MDALKNDDCLDSTPQPMEILSIVNLDIDTIRVNPDQPRKHFDEAKLDELAESIRFNGIIEPVIVRPSNDDTYEIVAGERRFRAAVQAGLKSIPAVARSLGDMDALQISLIENIQREDIKPIECAHAYRRLMEDFGLTQEEISVRVGKKRSTVANTLRLLNLPVEIRASLDMNQISEGHARALLSIPDQKYQLRVWEKVIKQGLSVRQTERLARNPDVLRSSMTSGHVSRATRRHGQSDPNMADVEDKMRRYLGTKVSITRHGDKGKIEIEFYDEDDLLRILDLIGQG